MKKSIIIGMVLCIIAFASGLVLMLKGKIATETLVALTGIASFAILNWLTNKVFNRDNTPIKNETKYRTQPSSYINQTMGL